MNEMKTSEKGINLIKLFEGFEPEAYMCPAGVWTIGYGHIRAVKKGDKVNIAQAEILLRDDLQEAEKEVSSQLSLLNQNQFDALVSFVFNVGVQNFRDSTLLKWAKNNANDELISLQFKRWVYAGKKVLPGLERRREAESKLYFSK